MRKSLVNEKQLITVNILHCSLFTCFTYHNMTYDMYPRFRWMTMWRFDGMISIPRAFFLITNKVIRSVCDCTPHARHLQIVNKCQNMNLLTAVVWENNNCFLPRWIQTRSELPSLHSTPVMMRIHTGKATQWISRKW